MVDGCDVGALVIVDGVLTGLLESLLAPCASPFLFCPPGAVSGGEDADGDADPDTCRF